jgi:hypothetical protein
MIKKAKKCSTISERDNNENPSFELELSQSYAHGYTLVSLLIKHYTYVQILFFEGTYVLNY